MHRGAEDAEHALMGPHVGQLIGHMVFQPLPDSVRVEIDATGRQPIGGVMIGRIVFFLEFYLYVLD